MYYSKKKKKEKGKKREKKKSTKTNKYQVLFLENFIAFPILSGFFSINLEIIEIVMIYSPLFQRRTNKFG